MSFMDRRRSLDQRRKSIFIWILLILCGGSYVVLRAQYGSSDLRGFHSAWIEVWQGSSDGSDLEDIRRYPLAFVTLFSFFGSMPRWSVAAIWYVVNLGCTFLIWKLTCHLLRIDMREQGILWPAAAGLFPFWLDNLVLGQNAPLLMLLVIAAVCLVELRRTVTGGILLGLATAIKLLPAVFLLIPAVRLQVRSLFAAGVVFVASCVGLTGIVLGLKRSAELNVSWFREVTSLGDGTREDPTRLATMRYPLRYNNQSIEATLARLLLPVNAGKKSHPFRVNVAAVAPESWRRLRDLFVAVVIITGLLAVVDSLWYRGGSDGTARALALLSTMLLLVSPLVWTHYFLWMFFPLAYLSSQRRREGRLPPVIWLWFAAVAAAVIPQARACGVNILASFAIFMTLVAPHLQRLRQQVAGILNKRVQYADM